MASLGKVVVLYDELPANASEDEQEVLLQAEAVSKALTQMEFDVIKLPFLVNDDSFSDCLQHINPSFVFNLVESVSSKSKLSYLAPVLLERLGIPYTGCPAASIFVTTNKIATKIKMKELNIPTPAWVSDSASDGFAPGDTYIIKALYEDASVGLCDGSVLSFQSIESVRETLSRTEAESQTEFFAEKYIDGREFSIPILERAENRKSLRLMKFFLTVMMK